MFECLTKNYDVRQVYPAIFGSLTTKHGSKRKRDHTKKQEPEEKPTPFDATEEDPNSTDAAEEIVQASEIEEDLGTCKGTIVSKAIEPTRGHTSYLTFAKYFPLDNINDN